MWSIVHFGKWKNKNKTMPQILVSDPDWFFWAIDARVFSKYNGLAREANFLNQRARFIKIPAKQAPKNRVQYWFTPDGKFAGIALIEKTHPQHRGSSFETRSRYLDLHTPRSGKTYDKLGYSLMLKQFRYYWFNNKPFTKSRVEAFFADAANFVPS